MTLLTRSEELILLAIWKLQGEAYCVTIRKMLTITTGDKWSLGSIFMPVKRMERNGLLTSQITGSTPERGGRHKRIYSLTDDGKKALSRILEIHNAMWTNVSSLTLESGS